jgi:hypothetical protein
MSPRRYVNRFDRILFVMTVLILMIAIVALIGSWVAK